MNNYWTNRLDFIKSDITRILNLTKTSVLLQEFNQSISFLDLYLNEMAILTKETKLFTSSQLFQNIISENMDAYKTFINKQSNIVSELQNAIDIVEKRKLLIEELAHKYSKRRNSNEKKKMPNTSSKKNTTKSIVLENYYPPNITYNSGNDIAELHKHIEKINKKQEKLEKKIAEEKEKREKLLAKEKEKREKILAKEDEKRKIILAKEDEKRKIILAKKLKKQETREKVLAKKKEQILAKEKDKLEKLLAKEKTLRLGTDTGSKYFPQGGECLPPLMPTSK